MIDELSSFILLEYFWRFGHPALTPVRCMARHQPYVPPPTMTLLQGSPQASVKD